jgi:hypothetical protein
LGSQLTDSSHEERLESAAEGGEKTPAQIREMLVNEYHYGFAGALLSCKTEKEQRHCVAVPAVTRHRPRWKQTDIREPFQTSRLLPRIPDAETEI